MSVGQRLHYIMHGGGALRMMEEYFQKPSWRTGGPHKVFPLSDPRCDATDAFRVYAHACEETYVGALKGETTKLDQDIATEAMSFFDADVLYHGGPDGLRTLMPSAETGASASSLDGGVYGNERRLNVHLTTTAEIARFFALRHPHGKIYSVRPKDCTKLAINPFYMGIARMAHRFPHKPNQWVLDQYGLAAWAYSLFPNFICSSATIS